MSFGFDNKIFKILAHKYENGILKLEAIMIEETVASETDQTPENFSPGLDPGAVPPFDLGPALFQEPGTSYANPGPANPPFDSSGRPLVPLYEENSYHHHPVSYENDNLHGVAFDDALPNVVPNSTITSLGAQNSFAAGFSPDAGTLFNVHPNFNNQPSPSAPPFAAGFLPNTSTPSNVHSNSNNQPGPSAPPFAAVHLATLPHHPGYVHSEMNPSLEHSNGKGKAKADEDQSFCLDCNKKHRTGFKKYEKPFIWCPICGENSEQQAGPFKIHLGNHTALQDDRGTCRFCGITLNPAEYYEHITERHSHFCKFCHKPNCTRIGAQECTAKCQDSGQYQNDKDFNEQKRRNALFHNWKFFESHFRHYLSNVPNQQMERKLYKVDLDFLRPDQVATVPGNSVHAGMSAMSNEVTNGILPGQTMQNASEYSTASSSFADQDFRFPNNDGQIEASHQQNPDQEMNCIEWGHAYDDVKTDDIDFDLLYPSEVDISP